MAFAEAVAKGQAPFDSVSFEGFRGSFDSICEALNLT